MRNEFMASAAKPLPRVPLEMVQIDSPIVYEPTTTPPIPLFPKLRRPVETAKPQNRKPEVPQKVKPADFAEAVSETDKPNVDVSDDITDSPNSVFTDYSTKENNTSMCDTPATPMRDIFTESPESPSKRVHRFSASGPVWFKMPDQPSNLSDAIVEEDSDTESTDYEMDEDIRKKWYNIFNTKVKRAPPPPPDQDPVRKGSIVPGLFKRTLSTSSPKKTSFPSPAKVSTNMLRYPHLEMNRAPATSNSVFLPSTTSTGTQSSHVHPHLYRAHLRSPATPTRHKFDAIPQMAAKKCSIGIQTDEPKHLTPEENHLLNNFSELRGSIQSALSSETRGLGDSNLTEDYIDFSQYLDKKFQLV
ncbi:hypothetical protein PSN45_003826 [Yamadazyma tenuis]|uniref:uncharacterized protein n=1 Tax=Candida tenuis TaxID=2315449 RepID=UPI0027A4DE9A|nr:hypothetical protein PSN45_003826 [Yamadazyma tenuis]